VSGRRLAALLAASATVHGGLLSGDESGPDRVLELSVDDPRPVAKAMELLTARHGYVITYEDPPYSHESEIKDVTLQVRRDLDKFEPGKAPKVFVPRGGRLDLSYSVSSETGHPADPAALIQEVLDAHAAGDQGGVFRLEQSGEVFHVVPVKVRNSAGEWVDHASILDVAITLPAPAHERRLADTVDAICDAVSDATGENVWVGSMPTNFFMQHFDRLEARDEIARNVLMRALAGKKRKLTWRLFYGPGREQSYALNIQLLPEGPQ
jgi:hypothetical protein